SASVPADIQEAAKNWVRQALRAGGPDDQAAIVTFGARAQVELPLGAVREHGIWSAPLAGEASNLGSALQLAADLLPATNSGPLRRVVILSDGNETLGDAQRDLLRPQLRDVEVAVLALPGRLQDTAITSFVVPPAVREGEPTEMRLAMYSATQQDGTLRVWARGGEFEQLLYEQPIQLETGPREVIVDLGALPKGGWSFKAELAVTSDSRLENNTSWAFTIVGEAPRVLIVSDGSDAALRETLQVAKVQLDGVGPTTMPAQIDRLLQYEAIILNNVHAGELGRPRQEALRDYVANYGKGLIVIGGEKTFGLGEYADSPLEAALPVTVQPPEKDQSASLALVLVIDRSGSMSATDTGDRRATRMDLAKEGAIQAVETVQEGDQVGVVSFDYDARWVAEVRHIRGAADTRAIADRIATIQPDGGTDIYRGMEMAFQGLQRVQARVKHVIVLTDGEQGSPAPFPTLTNSMRRAGITVSTLGIASTGKAAADLQNIARIGQGRYYVTNNARDVPRIMTQEARLAGRSFKQERDFKPRLVMAAPAVRGLVPADFPQLHGYVRVSPKPGSETVLTSDQEETVLAQWQYGLGRAMAWTADAEGEWSKDWMGTEQFNRLWPQAVRWAMPAPATPGVQVQIRPVGDQAYVRVESVETAGEFRNHLTTVADISFPDGSARRVTLPQSAPGRYEGRFKLEAPGAYFINITQTDGAGQPVATQLTGYALPYLPEYRLSDPNRVLLERLAAETGGPVLNSPEETWKRDGVRSSQPQDVWNYLIMAALMLYVTDVAVRRVRPSIHDVAGLRGAAGRRLMSVRPLRLRLPAFRLHPIQGGRPR
ncbi:MAG TPA: VWA domain-containing protein, partial [Chloroflexota bacterium]|nr:VWA domain-containing protein [Chloroflexota bacterium]